MDDGNEVVSLEGDEINASRLAHGYAVTAHRSPGPPTTEVADRLGYLSDEIDTLTTPAEDKLVPALPQRTVLDRQEPSPLAPIRPDSTRAAPLSATTHREVPTEVDMVDATFQLTFQLRTAVDRNIRDVPTAYHGKIKQTIRAPQSYS